MRNISADYIFIDGQVVTGCQLSIDEDGLIQSINYINEDVAAEHHKGLLVPGFVNAHCHLELSHTKGLIAEKTGLQAFIDQVVKVRNYNLKEIDEAIAIQDKLMYDAGIIAVGDIVNTANTIDVKRKSNLYYHSFIELFGLQENLTQLRIHEFEQLKDKFDQYYLSNSFTPHAPYSVSPNLFKWINKQSSNYSIISIHNQECAAEDQFFKKKEGRIKKQMEAFGVDLSYWKATGKSSVESVLPYFDKNQKILLVHNTYTSAEDIEKVNNSGKNIWWCFCPNANLYIEGKLPNINYFDAGQIVIGTDSLASNHQLSILEELKTTHQHYPGISLMQLLTWATINGAKLFGIEDKYGTISVDKTPGLVLIEGLDNLRMNQHTKAKRID